MRRQRGPNSSTPRHVVVVTASRRTPNDQVLRVPSFLRISHSAMFSFLTRCWVCPVLHDAQLTAQARQTATGGSAMKAVEVIMEHGVPEDRIIFINLVGAAFHLYSISFDISYMGRTQISAPEGLKKFAGRYPSLKVARPRFLPSSSCV